MGFRVERTVYQLRFPDSAYEGMEIRVRAMTIGERLAYTGDLWIDEDDSREVAVDKQRRQLEMFLAHVTEWNLEDEAGRPLPRTYDALIDTCEADMVSAMVAAWREGRSSVPAPLDVPSPDSGPLEIPMTVLAS